MSGLPFDHLTLAEVAHCQRLSAEDWADRLPDIWYGELHRLLKRRHPPIYDPKPPGPLAA